MRITFKCVSNNFTHNYGKLSLDHEHDRVRIKPHLLEVLNNKDRFDKLVQEFDKMFELTKVENEREEAWKNELGRTIACWYKTKHYGRVSSDGLVNR